MAYRSSINIGLGETPKTTDPAMFPDMVEIYNAIHILSSYMGRKQRGGFSFTLDTTTNIDVEQGEIITFCHRYTDWEVGTHTYIPADTWGKPITGTTLKVAEDSPIYTGFLKGAYSPFRRFMRNRSESVSTGLSDSTSMQRISTMLSELDPMGAAIAGSEDVHYELNNELLVGSYTGIALTSAEAGGEVEIGMGVGMLDMEGVAPGQLLIAAPLFESSAEYIHPDELQALAPIEIVSDLNKVRGDGQLYLLDIPIDELMYIPVGAIVGVGVDEGRAMLDFSFNKLGGAAMGGFNANYFR